MIRLKTFRFMLTDGQEATFHAPTYAQALELALTFSRARGLRGYPADISDQVAWNLPRPSRSEAEQVPLDSAA